ncbi:unnamed protein product [Cylicocyclus nassatus]|uniref:Uncharacterized protein n=1 Tax=Cylicocyclus nassatus TaxID=53992 RepID=A0AA36M309_CYLNA|nr:unnamed protein product [Cylicocyclus nassatus]
MHLASVRPRNVHLEEENLAAQGKKQVVNTPRRAFGDMKNTGTPGRNLLKLAASAQKHTLQIADANRDRSASLGRSTHKYSQSHPIAALNFNVSEDDEPIEGCNLEEDNCFTEKFEQQDSIVLVDRDTEQEEEYLQKLMSTSKLSDINEENEEIEFFGPEDDPDDYSYLFNNAETNTVLEPESKFYYEVPEDEHTGMARYTLDEMEELFASFNDVLII